MVIDEQDGHGPAGGAAPAGERAADRLPAIPLRPDGSVSYADRRSRRSRRFAVPVLIVTIGVAAGTAATLLLELL